MSFLLVIIAATAAGICMVSLTTYGAYVIANGLPPFRGGTARRLRHLAWGVASSMAAACVTLLAFPFQHVCARPLPASARGAGSGVSGRTSPRTATARTTPVILVHGLYHNPSAWMFYRPAFAGRGFGPVVTVRYPSFGSSFDALVDTLDATVRDLGRTLPGGPPPLLVGHSLGGLVIRAWLARQDGAPAIRGVITLGTPHQGSTLAFLGVGALARSLTFKGALVQRIEQMEHRPGVPCVAIRSDLDNMVLPLEGLRIRTPGWQELAGPPVSHVCMLWSRKTRELVLEVAQRIRDRHGAA